MALFDQHKRMSFDDQYFPYKRYSVKGAYRKHVHEYPHVAGGAVEKLGRSLYEVEVHVDFRGELDAPQYQGTQELIGKLANLRTLWENGKTAELHIPHIGTIKAFADRWSEDIVNTDRSGISTVINFIEDQESAFLALAAIQIRTSGFDDAAVALQGDPRKSDASIWSTINNAISALLSVKNQADLYGSLLVAKIDGLISLLSQADETLDELNDPDNIELLDALHRLWDATLSLKNDALAQDDFLREFTVPLTMTVGQAAAAIYGDSSRGGELMQLNVLADPLAIPGGSKLRYYVTDKAA